MTVRPFWGRQFFLCPFSNRGFAGPRKQREKSVGRKVKNNERAVIVY